MDPEPDKAPDRPAMPAQLPWAVSLLLLMAVLQMLPDAWRMLLRYDRQAVIAGQAWRLLTAGFAHLGWGHLALNGAALLIMAWVFTDDRGGAKWLADLALCTIAVHLGLLFFSPQIAWVLGLSGSLHGLFVIGALTWISQRQRIGWVLLAGVVAKVGWEQVAGEMPLSREIVGGSVVVDAHLWGLLGGFLFFALDIVWRRLAARL